MARNEAMSMAKPRIDGHEVSGEVAWLEIEGMCYGKDQFAGLHVAGRRLCE